MTDTWKSGITYLHSLTMTDTTTTQNLNRRILIPVWDWSVLACVVQDVDSMFDIDTMKALRDHVCRQLQVYLMEQAMRQMFLSVLSRIISVPSRL